MSDCKLCGLQVQGKEFDPDNIQYHAFLYHLDLVDVFGWKGVSELIKTGKVTVTRKLTINQLQMMGELEE